MFGKLNSGRSAGVRPKSLMVELRVSTWACSWSPNCRARARLLAEAVRRHVLERRLQVLERQGEVQDFDVAHLLLGDRGAHEGAHHARTPTAPAASAPRRTKAERVRPRTSTRASAGTASLDVAMLVSPSRSGL